MWPYFIKSKLNHSSRRKLQRNYIWNFPFEMTCFVDNISTLHRRHRRNKFDAEVYRVCASNKRQHRPHYIAVRWASWRLKSPTTRVFVSASTLVSILRLKQNGRHFPADILNYIFLNENIWISNKMSLKCVPWCLVDDISALIQIMAWRHPGDRRQAITWINVDIVHRRIYASPGLNMLKLTNFHSCIITN